MRLFLDTSTLLAAAGSATGASREVFRRAPANDWTLIVVPYVVDEVLRNLSKLRPRATADWAKLRLQLSVMDNVLTLDRPSVFDSASDRPVLFSALAWSDILLTLDRTDFSGQLGNQFYELMIRMPAQFLAEQRAAGRLR